MSSVQEHGFQGLRLPSLSTRSGGKSAWQQHWCSNSTAQRPRTLGSRGQGKPRRRHRYRGGMMLLAFFYAAEGDRRGGWAGFDDGSSERVRKTRYLRGILRTAWGVVRELLHSFSPLRSDIVSTALLYCCIPSPSCCQTKKFRSSVRRTKHPYPDFICTDPCLHASDKDLLFAKP